MNGFHLAEEMVNCESGEVGRSPVLPEVLCGLTDMVNLFKG